MPAGNNNFVDTDAKIKDFLNAVLSSEGIVVDIRRTFINYNGVNRSRVFARRANEMASKGGNEKFVVIALMCYPALQWILQAQDIDRLVEELREQNPDESVSRMSNIQRVLESSLGGCKPQLRLEMRKVFFARCQQLVDAVDEAMNAAVFHNPKSKAGKISLAMALLRGSILETDPVTAVTMSEKIVQLNEEVIKGQIKELVRGSVGETLNELLEKEAESLTQAARYERNETRQGYRSGHYDRNLTTTSGDVTLHMPRLKGVSFETAIIERYRLRESSVEEALIEMYLAGVSVRRVEDITEALWGSKVSPATISELNKKAYVHIEDWRNRPLQGGRYPYIYVDGIYLRRNWGGEYENVSVLVAIAVNEDGFREVLGAAEGMKEDKASWVSFFQWLRGRGLDGVKLIVGDKCMGMLEAVGEVFPDAKYQRCTVHFYRNVFSVVPKSKIKIVAKMLKAIHAQESKKASREKAKTVVAELRAMKLKEAAKKVEDGIEETLTYCDFPSEHWTRIRTNNVIERLNREIRRCTRVVGTFSDGNSALILVCARLRHVAGTQWGCKKYMNMKHLEAALDDAFIAG